MKQRKPLIRQPREGDIVSRAFLRVTGEHSDNRLTILGPTKLEPSARGPAAHSHEFEETFVVFRGVVTFYTDEGEVAVAEGGLVHIPAGASHTFANRSDDPAELMTITTPSGLEHFFAERAKRETDDAALSDEENVQLIKERGGTVTGDRPSA
jgi:quercetin dioxygenase-like cupin family protein